MFRFKNKKDIEPQIEPINTVGNIDTIVRAESYNSIVIEMGNSSRTYKDEDLFNRKNIDDMYIYLKYVNETIIMTSDLKLIEFTLRRLLRLTNEYPSTAYGKIRDEQPYDSAECILSIKRYIIKATSFLMGLIENHGKTIVSHMINMGRTTINADAIRSISYNISTKKGDEFQLITVAFDEDFNGTVKSALELKADWALEYATLNPPVFTTEQQLEMLDKISKEVVDSYEGVKNTQKSANYLRI